MAGVGTQIETQTELGKNLVEFIRKSNQCKITHVVSELIYFYYNYEFAVVFGK